jgi:hypothetical protein
MTTFALACSTSRYRMALYSERPHATRGSVDQDMLSLGDHCAPNAAHPDCCNCRRPGTGMMGR